jgi:hypothetical protein
VSRPADSEEVALSRPPRIHHCTSLPYRFFGRTAELTLLNDSLHQADISLVAFAGPGGQGKTAIVQHWMEGLARQGAALDGLFLWSFYRGKEADGCLRKLYAYAAGRSPEADISASYCVDHVLPVLRRERWAVVLDGTEVAQHEGGPWAGRFLHPELGRLLEEIASAPSPGVTVLTTRFLLPTLELRRHARLLSLGSLDPASARQLLQSLGVQGTDAELDEASRACGYHAKAVELLGTYLVRFQHGRASQHCVLSSFTPPDGASEEERKVARVLAAFQTALEPEAQDVLALATAFREPPTEARLLDYLASRPVEVLLHTHWGRRYQTFEERGASWLAVQVEKLVLLRLLERVGRGAPGVGVATSPAVIDAHPLVRRAFSHVLGPRGHRQNAQARAGFLRGRPDRRRPETLEEAREEIELFHAHCDAGLWNEADSTFVALENPKHRFLAPAVERDLLLRYFPDGDWRRPPLWPGFGRYRSLAISLEMLGQFADALAVYRESDAPLRGDALLILGRLEPFLNVSQAPHPWNVLWQGYRAHALCLAGRADEGVAVALSVVPVDVYEWIHVFECLLRADKLALIDLRSLMYRPPLGQEHPWSDLARQRMRADLLRLQGANADGEVAALYGAVLESYDRSGLPYERALSRLGYGRWLLSRGEDAQAEAVNAITLELAERYRMAIVAADAWSLEAALAHRRGAWERASAAQRQADLLRSQTGYRGRPRP